MGQASAIRDRSAIHHRGALRGSVTVAAGGLAVPDQDRTPAEPGDTVDFLPLA
jgi:hypothetical protein